MSGSFETLTIETLRSIQGSLVQFRDETNTRLERLETGLLEDRRNSIGMLVMMHATADDFEQRVGEERVAPLGTRA